MNPDKLVLLLTACLALAAGCQFGQPQDLPLEAQLLQRGYTIKGPVDQLQAFRINGWNHVDRNHVILWASANRPYLVATRNPCDGLRSAEVLAFTTTIGILSKFEKLVVRGAGNWVENCLVEQIYELERLELAD